MSVAPSIPSELARAALGRTAGRAVAILAAVVRAAGFWTAALVPLSYPVLLATGAAAEHPLTFVALLAVNAVGLVVGHGHRA
jgi:hypothetical protein